MKLVPLTDKSPRDLDFTTDAVKLWGHQRAMLKKCIDLENKAFEFKLDGVKYHGYTDNGLLSAAPGSGKTYTRHHFLWDTEFPYY